MILLNEAIEAGAWLQVKTNNFSFKIKLFSFSKIDLANIDNPEYLTIPIESNVWLLKLEIMNTSKEQIYSSDMRNSLKLADDEGYTFSFMDYSGNDHLIHRSEFAKESGVSNLDGKELPPKIRRSGAFVIELPDDFEQLFLTVQDGEISDENHTNPEENNIDPLEELEFGMKCYRSNLYQQAHSHFLKVANFSHTNSLNKSVIAQAQNNLGDLYFNGKGVEKNEKEAMFWLKKAAMQDNSEAQQGLGSAYALGRGVEKNYEQAIYWLQKSAEQGNSTGQLNLGLLYKDGLGVEQNYEKAVDWLQKSAYQGNTNAQTQLGLQYKAGQGVGQNYEKAIGWLQKAAELGNPLAQNSLGYMYFNGNGSDVDYAKAVFWFRKSIDQDNRNAYDSLACMYKEGLGVKQDYKEAIRLWKIGAEKGCSESKSNLGEMYENGNGASKDYAKAISWYQQAIDGDYKEAQEKLDSLQEKIRLEAESVEIKQIEPEKIIEQVVTVRIETEKTTVAVPLLKDEATQDFEDMF